MKLKLKLFPLCILLASAAGAMAQGASMNSWAAPSRTSTVQISVTGSAQATGGTLTEAWTGFSAQGSHVGPNGATTFAVDGGSKGSGYVHANAAGGWNLSEVRTVSPGASSVANTGNIWSRGYAADPITAAGGEMRVNTGLTGPRGSALSSLAVVGYNANGTYTASGDANTGTNASYTTSGRRHIAWTGN